MNIRFTDYNESIACRKGFENVGNIEIDGTPLNTLIAQEINKYRDELLIRLIPHLNDLSLAKDSETYIAITEIAERRAESISIK